MSKGKGSDKTPNEGTVVETCSCVHKGQDELHGDHKRVKNNSSKGPRCTVCGKVG